MDFLHPENSLYEHTLRVLLHGTEMLWIFHSISAGESAPAPKPIATADYVNCKSKKKKSSKINMQNWNFFADFDFVIEGNGEYPQRILSVSATPQVSIHMDCVQCVDVSSQILILNFGASNFYNRVMWRVNWKEVTPSIVGGHAHSIMFLFYEITLPFWGPFLSDSPALAGPHFAWFGKIVSECLFSLQWIYIQYMCCTLLTFLNALPRGSDTEYGHWEKALTSASWSTSQITGNTLQCCNWRIFLYLLVKTSAFPLSWLVY